MSAASRCLTRRRFVQGTAALEIGCDSGGAERVAAEPLCEAGCSSAAPYHAVGINLVHPLASEFAEVPTAERKRWGLL